MPPPRAGLTPRAKVLLPIFMIVLLGLSYWRLRPSDDARREFAGKTMGTTYSVLLGQNEKVAEGLEKRLQAELDRVEGLMSTYREQSELSRFNRHASLEPFAVSSDMATVVSAAQDISRQTDGAFDVTVRPLVALWGFGAGAKVEAPNDERVEAAKAQTGYQKLHVSSQPPTLTKELPSLSCDLSAIAKGYAVDRLAALLEAEAIDDYLVEVGGELRVRGMKSAEQRWRIGIERPDSMNRQVSRSLELSDTGLATSGDYRNYYEKDGIRVSHTIDPRTGRPITHALASVTVLHEQAMVADGYATAINVLGPTEGLALAERLKLPVSLLVRKPDGTFETLTSSRFDRLAAPEATENETP